ncbi:hypothetical protein B5566_13720 [Mycobacterium sp. MHSD3]|nr:alcohol dehydrogenase catalytic domain-containing protein [Mycobacteroides chelonae]PKQ57406.1 hypothetical protein B5566_13720 [Mycobacterium sp. MHSD3]
MAVMRSLVYVGPGKVEWREAAEPVLQGDCEALVVPVAASRCNFDIAMISGEVPLRPPFPIGHEAVVKVVSIGDGVTSVRPGDIAVVVWHIACGGCDRCLRGMTGHCRQVPPGSSYGVGGPWGGLFDDLVRVPFADAMLTPLPSGIEPREFSAAGDGLGLGHAIVSRNMHLQPERVAVLGCGEHGLYQVAFAVALGMPYVAYADQDPERRSIASSLGAHAVAASPDQLEGTFGLIIDVGANADWLYSTIGMLEPEGVIECVGGHFADMRLPGFLSYLNGATVRFGLGNNGPHVRPTIDIVSQGLIRPSTIWAAEIDWDGLPEAFTAEPRKLVALRTQPTT